MNYTAILNPSIIHPLILRNKFSLITVWISGFFLIIFLTGFYIFQVSSVTQASFSIANYEKQIAGLDKEFKSMQVNFSNSSSQSDIERLLADKGYEKVGKINYIQVLEGAVAAK